MQDIHLITYGILIFTVICSMMCFNNEARLSKFLFIPYQIKHHREHHRFLSGAFIHADYMHLFFNMYGLYIFGGIMEDYFMSLKYGPAAGEILFLVFYSTSIYAASLADFLKYKDDSSYSALGASGAVNAIVFAFILVAPTAPLGLLIIPGIRVPAWIFGLIYLGISYYLSKRKTNTMSDNIGHSAHFWGALYGILFMIIVRPALFTEFIQKIAGGQLLY
jgi:membrane associated rhomboid family serine protease